MNNAMKFFVVLVASLTLTLGLSDFAEAKRMGSGNSFGSKFSQGNSVQRNSANPSQAASPGQQTNMERKQQLASKGGLMGLLGGLALGGILGALFFGGAFEGLNFLDILLFAVIAFAIYKFVASRRRAQPTMAGAGAGGYAPPTDDVPAQESYQRDNASPTAGGAVSGSSSYSSANSGGPSLDDLRGEIPKNFDQRTFINGAKACFNRLQAAWDQGDLAEIRQFTTDHVFAEIQDQFRARGGETQTEVLSLNAQLLRVEDIGSKMEAVVLFEAEMREDGAPAQVAEIWHFTRPTASTQPTWFVDGIQQVEG